ncbi:acyl-CoA reductase [Paraflavitalea speifideaquila]|uniref:acyl-CoA reductase n=1 Tax=Paraflavitalea speifideaquila TaxID=3076558 RepID=UPI0028E4ABD8|nr:acyl-CoA reductase [Paraflavitalea speifideiaquila]
MNLQQRIDLGKRLGEYILSADNQWAAAKEKASRENGWFTPEFIELSIKGIGYEFLNAGKLSDWATQYGIPAENAGQKNVGIVMAGNIPLVGFHDFLSVFMSGHGQTIKPSSKDEVLIKHLVEQLHSWVPATQGLVTLQPMLKGCDAYIATGSNNSARYFDYYFAKYPHIIRRNRTSVAILDGNETVEELALLADDVYQYFGLGCRNVTQLYVPADYDFVPLLETFKKYKELAGHHKYKNNYDYQLAILILNKSYYMTNGSIILHENASPFSPISQLHYSFYKDAAATAEDLANNTDIQCIVGKKWLPFGQAQQPGLTDYADGIDTMRFLVGL